MEEIGSNETSQQSAYHADDDVTDTTIAAPFSRPLRPRKPAIKPTTSQGNYSHNKILDNLSIMFYSLWSCEGLSHTLRMTVSTRRA